MIGYDKEVIEDGNTSSDSLTDELDEEEYNDTVDMDLGQSMTLKSELSQSGKNLLLKSSTMRTSAIIE